MEEKRRLEKKEREEEKGERGEGEENIANYRGKGKNREEGKRG